MEKTMLLCGYVCCCGQLLSGTRAQQTSGVGKQRLAPVPGGWHTPLFTTLDKGPLFSSRISRRVTRPIPPHPFVTPNSSNSPNNTASGRAFQHGREGVWVPRRGTETAGNRVRRDHPKPPLQTREEGSS